MYILKSVYILSAERRMSSGRSMQIPEAAFRPRPCVCSMRPCQARSDGRRVPLLAGSLDVPIADADERREMAETASPTLRRVRPQPMGLQSFARLPFQDVFPPRFALILASKSTAGRSGIWPSVDQAHVRPPVSPTALLFAAVSIGVMNALST